ncbi:MAG: signal peptidase I [Verrucomicrobia bacterium]|nr:signal peptidase I [Verrucomicrobiota bacterium]
MACRPYRQGRDMAGQVSKLLRHQRDILTSENLNSIEAALHETRAVLDDPKREADIPQAILHLEQVANNNFRHYPNPIARENFEVFLVAIAVALSVRTFFIQPFKIPTGSMQPTLWGNEELNLRNNPEAIVPGFLGKIADFALKGTSYYELVAKKDGTLEAVSDVKTVIPFLLKKRDFLIGGVKHTLWNPPPVLKNAGRPPTDYLIQAGDLHQGDFFKAGEHVVKFKIVRGDFLFVDRLTYNFRPPRRGEIIVFKTEGIRGIPGEGQFYIKRLVALGDEKVSIGNDRHLYINGTQLDKSTPGFEKVYGFNPDVPPRESRYSGHVNNVTYNIARGAFGPNHIVFMNENAVFEVRPDHVMAMGDNTMNSSDSRSWGDFPKSNIVGKFAFAFWPFLREDVQD